jgi:cytochrome b6-f complex iron-sulfur subunit
MESDKNMEGTICLLPDVDPSDEGGRRISRRGFIKAGMGTLASLALIEMGGAGFLFLRARSMEGKFGGTVTAGPVDSYPTGSVTEFADGHFFLIRAADGGFLAVHNRCTHLGCTVNWVESDNVFICPCHAASFDFFGNFEGPPVPRPLDTFRVSFEDTAGLVDTSLPQQRDSYQPDQLVYCPADSQTARAE